MSFNLPLKYMSLREKLAAMESLLEDIARTPEALESPAWHKDLLDERRQRLVDGQSQFVDWETAKAVIRSKLS
ncbi:MAG: acyl-protein synthetase [Nitrospira sp.]|nr:MAG: acyl-protein synthetase [Nitrospira sp.]